MRIEIIILIVLMALVTYIPRAIPFVLTKKIKYNEKFEKFLRLIPYTAMTALIFPGLLSADPANIWIGIAGAIAAAVTAFFRLPVMVSVLAAALTDFVLYCLI